MVIRILHNESYVAGIGNKLIWAILDHSPILTRLPRPQPCHLWLNFNLTGTVYSSIQLAHPKNGHPFHPIPTGAALLVVGGWSKKINYIESDAIHLSEPENYLFDSNNELFHIIIIKCRHPVGMLGLSLPHCVCSSIVACVASVKECMWNIQTYTQTFLFIIFSL